MATRQGYASYREAAEWMRLNKGRDVSTTIGGVMGKGHHQATVVEKWDSKGYVEYIFRSTENLMHKERCFGRSITRFHLGGVYKFELDYGGDGNCRIEAAGGGYKLLHLDSSAHIYNSERIAEVFQYVKDHNFKLAYLRIKWAKEVV